MGDLNAARIFRNETIGNCTRSVRAVVVDDSNADVERELQKCPH
jgi:hypothetical protein